MLSARTKAWKRATPLEAGVDGEMLEEEGPDPPALEAVLDEEGDLGDLPDRRLLDDVVAADCHDLPLVDDDEGHPVLIVDGGEVPHLVGRGGASHSEEALVQRPGTDPGEEPDVLLRVLGTDGPELNDLPVLEHDVELEVRRIDGHWRGLYAQGSCRHTRRRSAAHRVSWLRLESCSLRSTAETWDSTVFTEMKRSSPISRYVYPRATSRSTSRSRGLI